MDDNQLAVSTGNVTVQQTGSNQTANVTFLLNGATSQPVTVDYQIVDGTALQGTDYATSGTFTYNGQAGASFTYGTTTTAAQVMANLDTIAALTGKTGVTAMTAARLSLLFRAAPTPPS